MFFSIIFFLLIRLPPSSTRIVTLFPYTTLFRALGGGEDAAPILVARRLVERGQAHPLAHDFDARGGGGRQVHRLWDELLFIDGFREAGVFGGQPIVDRKTGIAVAREAAAVIGHRAVLRAILGKVLLDRKSTRLNSSH